MSTAKRQGLSLREMVERAWGTLPAIFNCGCFSCSDVCRNLATGTCGTPASGAGMVVPAKARAETSLAAIPVPESGIPYAFHVAVG